MVIIGLLLQRKKDLDAVMDNWAILIIDEHKDYLPFFKGLKSPAVQFNY